MTRALAGLLAAAALGTVASGCGSDAGAGEGPRLAWAATPMVFSPDGLPGDRVLSGKVRNTGDRAVEIRADELLAVRDDGEREVANGRFVEAFGHGLYGPGGPPAPFQAGRYDQRRLGEIVELAPGAVKPLTVAWRGEARALQVGRWRLPLP